MMNRIRHLPKVLLPVALGAWLAAVPLFACQICFPIPKNSAADHLLSADRVVLARENPDRPFSLKPIEVLEGDGESPEIDLFLDSSTRRLLVVHPDRALVCAYRESDPDDKWLRVGVADELFGPLVREILYRAPRWKDTPRDRLRFFSRYLGHDDRQLRQLAHIEVARAPYNEIRDLGSVLSRAEIHAFLANFRYVEWHALYILLLAQSGDEEDSRIIVEHVHSAERFGSVNQLAAWATAWIETDEGKALDFFEEHYFQQPDRTKDEISALLMALSVHGNNGHVHLRDRIVDNYRLILSRHPDLARAIIGDLTNWQRWDLAGPVATIVAERDRTLDGPTRQLLRNYVHQATEGARKIPAAESGGGWSPAILLLLLVPVAMAIATRAGRSRRRRES